MAKYLRGNELLLSDPGNARLQGLERQLHLTGNQYNIALVSTGSTYFHLADFCSVHVLLTDDVFHCEVSLLSPHSYSFLSSMVESRIVSLSVQQSTCRISSFLSAF